MKLKRGFYTRDTLIVAKELLGKHLVRKIGRKTLVGKIVETEAYIGPKDRAAHSYNGKITERNKAEYLEGGHIYIYLVYGMYWQLNITTSGVGRPECVLIRALEPMQGFGKELSSKKIRNLANGPGKLCRWLELNKSFYGEDLTESKRIWLEEGEKIKPSQIVRAKRIGIDYAGKWKDKLWRLYIKSNFFVSKR